MYFWTILKYKLYCITRSHCYFRLPLPSELSRWLWWMWQPGLRLPGKNCDPKSPDKGHNFRFMSLINIKVVEQNEDWNRCIDDNSLTLGRCVYNCQDNEMCEDDCLVLFKTRQLDCPCEVILLRKLFIQNFKLENLGKLFGRMSMQRFRLSWINNNSRNHNSNRSCYNDITNWERGSCSEYLQFE